MTDRITQAINEFTHHVQSMAGSLSGTLPQVAQVLGNLGIGLHQIHHAIEAEATARCLDGTSPVALAVNATRRLAGQEPLDLSFPHLMADAEDVEWNRSAPDRQILTMLDFLNWQRLAGMVWLDDPWCVKGINIVYRSIDDLGVWLADCICNTHGVSGVVVENLLEHRVIELGQVVGVKWLQRRLATTLINNGIAVPDPADVTELLQSLTPSSGVEAELEFEVRHPYNPEVVLCTLELVLDAERPPFLNSLTLGENVNRALVHKGSYAASWDDLAPTFKSLLSTATVKHVD